MKTIIIPSLAAAFATALAFAGPAEDVTAAAKKLGDAPNYSWTQTSEIANAQFTPGPVNGQTEKGGYTVITREFNGNSISTVRKGEQMATQNFQTGEWMTAEEMRQQFANRGGGGGGGGGAPGGGGGGGGRGGRGGGGLFGGGAPNPAEEVATLASEAKGLKSVDGALVGDLNEAAVAQRLSFGGFGGRGGGGNPPPPPKDASGSVKFWLKD